MIICEIPRSKQQMLNLLKKETIKELIISIC